MNSTRQQSSSRSLVSPSASLLDVDLERELSPEVYQDADARTERFKEAAKAYEQAAVDADPTYKSKFYWQHAHTWEEVLDEVEKAVNSNKDASKLWGKIRKAFRSLGNNSKMFSA